MENINLGISNEADDSVGLQMVVNQWISYVSNYICVSMGLQKVIKEPNIKIPNENIIILFYSSLLLD